MTVLENLVFGPVPSRRLGRSIGINNIPHKICSYSCSYCQIGKAVKMQVKRQPFFIPDEIVSQVGQKLAGLPASEYPDYLTLVPDGEPSLDIRLGELIVKLKTFGIPVAVITNSSLLDVNDVQDALMQADYVSLKVDTVGPSAWKHINKPHKELDLNLILQSVLDFSERFKGELVTESMLINRENDSRAPLEALAGFLQRVNPKIAYIAIPTRPPAFENTLPADETAVALAYEIFTRHGLSAELLTGYEGNAFASSGNFIDDILSITAVHPMRKDAVLELMAHANATEMDLRQLVDNGLIKRITFSGQDFYLRKFNNYKNIEK